MRIVLIIVLSSMRDERCACASSIMMKSDL